MITVSSAKPAGDQRAAELADQVFGDAPGVAAGTQSEQGTRRLVHSAGHLAVRLRRRFRVLAHSWPPSGVPRGMAQR